MVQLCMLVDNSQQRKTTVYFSITAMPTQIAGIYAVPTLTSNHYGWNAFASTPGPNVETGGWRKEDRYTGPFETTTRIVDHRQDIIGSCS